eukprot:PITA_02858
MDVKTTFFQGSIKEEVCVEQPEGFEVHDRESHVCKLNKSLYGLKKAPWAWCKLSHSQMRELVSEFEMKDLGPMHYFLGLDVWKNPGESFLSQEKYVVKILERFGMVDYKPVTTPMELNFKKLCGSASRPELGNASEYCQLIRALMFLVNSRRDMCFTVNTLSQSMAEPHHIHLIGAKNLMRYLRGTITHGLRYNAGDVKLHDYSEVDWAGSLVGCKRTSGCYFSLVSPSISWMSRK